MTDSNNSKFSELDPPTLDSVNSKMDRHPLQFSNDGQGYTQQEMDNFLQSALLSMPYHQQTIANTPHGMIMNHHDTVTEGLITTSAHPHHSMYNTHMPSGHPLQLYTQQSLSQMSPSSLHPSTPSTPQTPHHGYLHHSILPSSSHTQNQTLASTPRQPPVSLQPIPTTSPSALELATQLSLSQSNSPEQSPSGTRPDRVGRLGSHGGVGRRIVLASPNGVHPISHGVTITGGTGHSHATKDSSGKFPCLHCHKTYLHLKHLKRHLLRHTGDRPYQCVLCKDTFSRSDILKRHFQKCSIRRGNPGNLTHLAHAHDHQRKKTKGVRESTTTLDSPTESSEPYSPAEPLMGDGTILINGGNGNLKRSTRACSQCVGLKLLCDGNTPCARCNQIGVDCIYLSDDSRRLASGKGMDSRDHFNFPPPAHPHAHMQLRTQGVQTYQSAPIAVRASPPYTPVTESAYATTEDTQGLNAVSFGDDYTFQHHQVRLQHKLNPVQENSLKLKSQSEANSLAISQSDQSLVYYSTSVSSQPSSSHSHHNLNWNFPDNDGYYTSVNSNISIHSNQSNNPGIYTYEDTPLTATPISLVDGGIVNWNVSIPQVDPFLAKCEHLKNLLFNDFHHRLSTPESQSSHNSEDGLSDDSDLREWLSPHHVQHFWESFDKNFQTHFPALHLPTFQFSSVYDGLALAIICHGAVYSDRGITVEQVRRLMERSMVFIEQNGLEGCNGDSTNRIISSDELQARALLASLATWHGNEHQRDRVRRTFGKLVSMAKNSCYHKPLTPREGGLDGWSYYHQTDKSLKFAPEWNWLAWVEQEKRNRIMFGIFLLDAALVIYYNEKPRLGLYDLRITLPSDDAPWEATTSEECFNLLGLNGEEASVRNVSGTRKPKQPELSIQLEEILTIGKEFRPGTTNAYGKFLLIHAVHVYVWQKQREFGLGRWRGGNNPEANQRITTQQKNLEILQFNQTVGQALDKWKKAWDADLISQFSNKRRSGFCRDGIAFYWLAVLFTRQKKRDLVLKDVRDRQIVTQVQQMLETVNRQPRLSYPLQEPGAVSGIDKKYGVDELAWDMKLLLAPIDKESESDNNKWLVKKER